MQLLRKLNFVHSVSSKYILINLLLQMALKEAFWKNSKLIKNISKYPDLIGHTVSIAIYFSSTES